MSALEEAFSNASGIVRFTARPEAIPGDLRLSWRLCALVLVLDRSRGRTASLEQIHFLTSAMRSEAIATIVLRWFDGIKLPDDPVIRYDPAMSRTIGLATASGLAIWRSQSIALTDSGSDLASSVKADFRVLNREKIFLSQLPKTVTQKAVHELLEVR